MAVPFPLSNGVNGRFMLLFFLLLNYIPIVSGLEDETLALMPDNPVCIQSAVLLFFLIMTPENGSVGYGNSQFYVYALSMIPVSRINTYHIYLLPCKRRTYELLHPVSFASF